MEKNFYNFEEELRELLTTASIICSDCEDDTNKTRVGFIMNLFKMTCNDYLDRETAYKKMFFEEMKILQNNMTSKTNDLDNEHDEYIDRKIKNLTDRLEILEMLV